VPGNNVVGFGCVKFFALRVGRGGCEQHAGHWLRHNPRRAGNATLWETREADACTGCWASSGYSVQGCAQLEQKLRQCMDAPVSSASPTNILHLSDPSSALQPKRRTTSITTSRGCIPRSRDLTSGINHILLVDRTLYIISFLWRLATDKTMRI
jgi:hypothetical protein